MGNTVNYKDELEKERRKLDELYERVMEQQIKPNKALLEQGRKVDILINKIQRQKIKRG